MKCNCEQVMSKDQEKKFYKKVRAISLLELQPEHNYWKKLNNQLRGKFLNSNLLMNIVFSIMIFVGFLYILTLISSIKEFKTISDEFPQAPKSVLSVSMTETDFCTLSYVSCLTKPLQAQKTTNPKVIRATITTYQAIPSQTDPTSCQGAMSGVNFCNPPFPTVANNSLKLGSKVKIRGVVYVVADRLNKHFGNNHFDILTTGFNTKWINEPVEIL